MTSQFDSHLFAARLRAKRGELGLREAEQQTDVSASTLSRLEQGETPILPTFVKLLDWLGAEPGEFIKQEAEAVKADLSMPERVELLLREDGKLSGEWIDAFMVLYLAVRRTSSE